MTNLFGAGGKHRNDGQTNRLDTERGRPVVCQDAETNMTIAVHVRMHWNVLPDENDLELQPNDGNIVSSSMQNN